MHKVVCFINFNFTDEEKTLDIGYIINYEYFGNDYDYEALKALYYYGFIQLGAERIQARWALNDKDNLAPLLKLGMKVTETRMADKFRPAPVGKFHNLKAASLSLQKKNG